MKKQVISTKIYIKCEASRRELWECQFTDFHCKLYNELFIFTLKTVNLTVFYSKIT